ncbi:MAG: trypsin-like peptidase domain-containing protein [Chloroflexi bacterium]|nr:trypsin-like peptidase domain-containing protein [Chloroflexota bacterium]
MATGFPAPFLLGPDKAAQLFGPEDFEQRFRSVTFPVPSGTVLLLYRQNQLVQEWPPGVHESPKGLLDSLRGALLGSSPPVHGWLVRTGAFSVPVQAGGLASSDRLPFVADMALSLQVTDARRLVQDEGWGKQDVSFAGLARLLSPHLEAALGPAISAVPADALPGPVQRAQLAQLVQDAARPVLRRIGITLLDFGAPLRLSSPRLERERVQEAETRDLESQAAGLEQKVRVLQRFQALIQQQAQEEALSKEKLEAILLEADKRRVLREEERAQVLRDMEAAREQGGYQKQAAIAIARQEAEFLVEEDRLAREGKLGQMSREQCEAELKWRVQEARLLAEIDAARIEGEEHARTTRTLEELRRQAQAEAQEEEAKRRREVSQVAAKGVVRIANADNETRVVPDPAGILEVSNCDNLVVRLKERVDRINVTNSDNVRIIAEKGYGTLDEANSDGVRIEAPTAEELEAERRRMNDVLQAEARRTQEEQDALAERARREREAADAAHRRQQGLEEEKARLEKERLQWQQELDKERARAMQQEDIRRQAGDRQTDAQTRVFRECLQAATEAMKQSPGMEPGLVTAPLLIAFSSHADLIMQITRLMYGVRLDSGKIALLEGRRDEFLSWVKEHYGALGKALETSKGTIRTVDDVLAVVDRFMGQPQPANGAATALRAPDWKQMLPRWSPSVVPLHTPAGFGTGFAVDAGGATVLATNAHMFGPLKDDAGGWLPGPAAWSGVAYANGKAVPLALLCWLNNKDIAILRPLEPIPWPPLPIEAKAASQGERAALLGFPLMPKQPLRRSPPRLSDGVVAGRWVGEFPFPLLNLTAPVNHGNSGGPVFGAGGGVIGVLSGMADGAQGMSFAIPAEVLSEALAMTPAYLEQPPAWAALRCPNGILALYPRGGRQLAPPMSSQGALQVTDPAHGVVVRAVSGAGPDMWEALGKGLAQMGQSLPPQDKMEFQAIVQEPYWVEVVLKPQEGSWVALLRWDPAEARGVIALGVPQGVAAPDWADHAIAIARDLYPA